MNQLFNPLPLIKKWLETNPYYECSDMPRKDLITFFKENNVPKDKIELALDCFISAGFGNEDETLKDPPIFGGYSYEN